MKQIEVAAAVIVRFFSTVAWDYPAFHLKMHCFFCSLTGEALHLNEHEAARWPQNAFFCF